MQCGKQHYLLSTAIRRRDAHYGDARFSDHTWDGKDIGKYLFHLGMRNKLTLNIGKTFARTAYSK